MGIWEIYLLGFIVALFYVTFNFKEFCENNHLDFSQAMKNNEILANIIFDSFGSWITVLIFYLNRNKQ